MPEINLLPNSRFSRRFMATARAGWVAVKVLT
jgi:hypothetical protein